VGLPHSDVSIQMAEAIPEEHHMTSPQAAALRVKWQQRQTHLSCDHVTVELELNDLGDTTGNYICILCGESVAHKQVVHAERVMNKAEPGALHPKSRRPVSPPICPHYKLGLERTGDDRLTSTYYCLDCTEACATKL
jgi:hypothetical protein